jgi:putative chitinase
MIGLITSARLMALAPRCDAPTLAPALDAAATAHAITTPRQIRHWLAQLDVESAGYTQLEENLNYSAARIRQVWPAKFPSLASALAVAHKPQALAGVVYADVDGNRGPADGWAYRGRGLIQITGRANYAAAGHRLAQPYATDPDLVAQPTHAALTAADFWVARGCDRALVDHANDAEACSALRRLINGGETDLAAAQAALTRAAQIWPG